MGRQKWILYSTGDSRYTSGKIYDALSLNASRKTLKLPGHSPITCDIRRFRVNPKADEQGFLLLVDVDGQKELLIAVPACGLDDPDGQRLLMIALDFIKQQQLEVTEDNVLEIADKVHDSIHLKTHYCYTNSLRNILHEYFFNGGRDKILGDNSEAIIELRSLIKDLVKKGAERDVKIEEHGKKLIDQDAKITELDVKVSDALSTLSNLEAKVADDSAQLTTVGTEGAQTRATLSSFQMEQRNLNARFDKQISTNNRAILGIGWVKDLKFLRKKKSSLLWKVISHPAIIFMIILFSLYCYSPLYSVAFGLYIYFLLL